MFDINDTRALASGNMKWKGHKGMGYAKGGKGIEHNPNSLRGVSGYGAGCPTGNAKLRRERSKGEINALIEGR